MAATQPMARMGAAISRTVRAVLAAGDFMPWQTREAIEDAIVADARLIVRELLAHAGWVDYAGRANGRWAIGLTHTAIELDDLIALATKRRWNATQLLEHIADAEQRERAKRSLDRRVDRARLGGFKPMADFDWAWPTRIDREAVDAAMRLDFLAAIAASSWSRPKGSARR